MTDKTQLPSIVSENTLGEIVKTWFTNLTKEDIVAIVSYPQNNSRMLFLDLISNRSLLKKYGINTEEYLFISVDFRVDHIDESQDMEKFLINKLRQYHIYKNGDEDLLTILEALDKTIVISAFGCEKLIEKNKIGLLQWISMISNYTSTKSLLFFDANIFSEGARSFFGQVSEFHPFIYFHPLLSFTDSKQYLQYLCTKWDITLDEKKIVDIIQTCGGQVILLKEILLFLSHNPNSTIMTALDSLDIQFTLSTMYNSFRNEKKLLNQIALNEEVDENEYHDILKYLIGIGMVRYDNQSLKIAIPLFKQFIENELSNHKPLSINNDHIYVGDIPVSINFSKREQEILRKLILNKNTITSREELARILWPEKSDGDYSDWAIDSHISRLRQKLVTIGLPKNVLVTKRGQGVFLNK